MNGLIITGASTKVDIDSTEERNLISLATPHIEAGVEEVRFGDDVWWSLSPSLLPTPQGPQAVYVLMMHMRSPMIGGTLSHISVFDNPVDLTKPDTLRQHIAALIEGLRQNRTAMLSKMEMPTQ